MSAFASTPDSDAASDRGADDDIRPVFQSTGPRAQLRVSVNSPLGRNVLVAEEAGPSASHTSAEYAEEPASATTTANSADSAAVTAVATAESRRKQSLPAGLTRPHPSGKRELVEEALYPKLGYGLSTWKKWVILTIVAVVQTSMNFNASVFSNAVGPMSEEWRLGAKESRLAQMCFLVAYAFGCELWAPWSEEYGRYPIMQLSLFLVNVWQIPVGLATNYKTVIIGRFLGGLSSAGGSVTFGMVADMWEADVQQYAVAYVVLSSVSGSIVGPVVGGFLQKHLPWRCNCWVQLAFGAITQLLHFFFVPETRSTILMDREAKRLRKEGHENVYSLTELEGKKVSFRNVLAVMLRPFQMFVTEPIVLCLSLLSGFSDALIFTFLDSYKAVFEQWNFGPVEIGLAFIPLFVGYVMAYFSFFPIYRKQRRIIQNEGANSLKPEARLWWLLYLAPLEAIGLIGFAWTSYGPPITPWYAPLLFSTLVGIANYAIYLATIDYMVAAYGPFSASATGGNGFARDLLAGLAALYATPLYTKIGGKLHLQWASTLLAGLAVIVTIPIYIFYWYGPRIREKSRFAEKIAGERRQKQEKREELESLQPALA